MIRRTIVRRALLLLLAVAAIFAIQASRIYASAGGSNYGDGGGGYSQLPACGPAFYGVELYVQGHLWRCIDAAPDHWILRS